MVGEGGHLMPLAIRHEGLNGFHEGDRVRVVRGRKYPIGLEGTVFRVLEDVRYGSHKLLLEGCTHVNDLGLDRAAPYMKNCEVIPFDPSDIMCEEHNHFQPCPDCEVIG